MAYPSKLDYDNAVWNLSKTVRCSEYQGSVARNDGIDLVAFTGGFSRVYLIDRQDGQVILRVWINEIQNVESIYVQAEKFFRWKFNPYFANFHYVQNGIEVNKQVWPILFMDWVDGLTLTQFINDRLPHSPQQIEIVAEEFLRMTRYLHQEGISHGDLQGGNIIVTSYLSQKGLKLIDYDTLYTPGPNELKRQRVGVSGYQHPRRATQDVDKQKWDYFSELVIYLSLCAYSEKPQLWQQKQENTLLFSKADFIDPKNSPAFKALNTMSLKVRRMAEQLASYCHEDDLNQLLPLEEVIETIQSGSQLIFYSGESVRTVDELVGICEVSTDEAVYRFANGDFEPWLNYIDRRDLFEEAIRCRQGNELPYNNLINFLNKTGVPHRLKIKKQTAPKPENHLPSVDSSPQVPSVSSSISQQGNDVIQNAIKVLNDDQRVGKQRQKTSTIEKFFISLASFLFLGIFIYWSYGLITAKKINVSATSPWEDSGFQVRQGDLIIVDAMSGEWSADFNNPKFPLVNASGYKKHLFSSTHWLY